MAITGFFGILLALTNKPEQKKQSFTPKQAFLLTSLAWIVLTAFAALPFCASSINLSFTDAYFEAMSGLTTTGSTVIVGLDTAPPGVLIWRALLSCLGGAGIIVMALSILPMLRVGGMQLFKSEASERDRHMPNVRSITRAFLGTYIGLTVLCMIAYRAAGMNFFDAFAHAMATIATSGMATHDSSFMYLSESAQYVAIIFMAISSLPFILLARALTGSLGLLLRDEQVKGFLSFIALAVAVSTAYAIFAVGLPAEQAFRDSAFMVTTLISTTGFINTDYTAWGPFIIGLAFFLSWVGGCAGSTAGGLKFYRFQIVASVTLNQIRQLIHPNGVFVPHFNGKPLESPVAASVLGFFFAYAMTFALLSLGMMLAGEDFVTSLSAVIATMSNVGPGLGDVVGPAGTYQSLSDAATWIGSAGMLLGRLELFTLFVMLLPSFWRR
jgi:trk system potassium uptake protein TrkH